MSKRILSTNRLNLRELNEGDAPFILKLVNEPDFIKNIADRGVRDIPGALKYMAGLLESYKKNGFGLYLVEIKETKVPLGICGLLKREALNDIDIGFAFLESFRRQGYAFESAQAIIEHACNTLALKKVVGLVAPHNTSSSQLLKKLGFTYERDITLPNMPLSQLWNLTIS